jgi:nucleotide-binding universal stress UspA family protein
MRNYLVVANRTLGGAELVARLDELAAAGDCHFHLVAPITQMSGSDHAVDAAWAPPVVHDGYEVGRALAEGRLQAELTRLRAQGVQADGEVVDPAPVDYIRDLTERVDFDLVVVSTLPRRLSGWLRLDLPSRIKKATGLPVEHIISSAGPSL